MEQLDDNLGAIDLELTVAQVALAWLLAKRAVTSIIIGAKKMEQLTTISVLSILN